MSLHWVAVVLFLGSVFALLLLILAWLIKPESTIQGRGLPGSLGWPIVGHMPYLSLSNPYPILNYYAQKYGQVFHLKLGSWDAVVLTDYWQIKRAFNSPDFAFRPGLLSFRTYSVDFHGVVFSNGPRWLEQRRFALRQLRDLGMGKASIETHIQREAQVVINELKKTVGEAIDLNMGLNIATTNVIWAIVAGKRMDYDDPEFIRLVNDLNRLVGLATSLGALAYVPWLAKILPGWWTGLDVFTKAKDSFLKYAQEVIDGHQETLDPNDPRDYMDHFLIQQNTNPESTFTSIQLKVTVMDLFIAGGETTAATLRWAVLLISKHPAVQKKLQEEIDDIVGEDRLPCLDDQPKMPYTAAVIHEVQRFADLVPLSVYHTCDKDVVFDGFHIRKGSVVAGFLGHSHKSEKFWSNPCDFDPQHFLDSNGELRRNVEGFFPFSTGKRACIGERLARAELFVFITYFFHQFNIRLADTPPPTLEGDPRSSVIRWPSPYKVILAQR